jgi:hypothetical protein
MERYLYSNKTSGDILLITASTADDHGIGAIFVRDLISGASQTTIQCHKERPFLQGLGAFPFLVFTRFACWQTIRLHIFRKYVLSYRVQNIESILRRHLFSSIILITSCPELIAIGRALVSRGHSLRVIIWDAPEYLVRNLRLSNKCIRTVLKDFDKLMSSAQAAAVISKQMLEQYCKRYGIPCIIVRHGTTPQPRIKRLVSKETINIVFAGSLYCKREWNAFIAALDHGKWHIVDRDVRLVYLGRFPMTDAIRPENLEYYSHLPHADALKIMSEMDIGYLPYWINPHYRLVVSTSFPSKMTAYAASGLSVFHHGPDYSSVSTFLEEYPFGVSCGSFEPSVIYNKLEQLVKIMGSPSIAKARDQALQYELSESAMKAAFQRFLLL